VNKSAFGLPRSRVLSLGFHKQLYALVQFAEKLPSNANGKTLHKASRDEFLAKRGLTINKLTLVFLSEWQSFSHFIAHSIFYE